MDFLRQLAQDVILSSYAVREHFAWAGWVLSVEMIDSFSSQPQLQPHRTPRTVDIGPLFGVERGFRI